MAWVRNQSDRYINGTEVKITDLRNKYCGCRGYVKSSTELHYHVYLYYHQIIIAVPKEYVRLSL